MSNQPFPQPGTRADQRVNDMPGHTAVSNLKSHSTNASELKSLPLEQSSNALQQRRKGKDLRRADPAINDLSQTFEEGNTSISARNPIPSRLSVDSQTTSHRDVPDSPRRSTGRGQRSEKQLPRELLKLKEAAQYLRCSPWRLRNLLHEGRLPFLQDGGGPIYMDRRDLDNYIDSNKRYG